MMAESTWEPINYESFINQFPPDTIKSMRQLERTYTKMCRQKMSVLLNEICNNGEILLPIYIYIYIYIHLQV